MTPLMIPYKLYMHMRTSLWGDIICPRCGYHGNPLAEDTRSLCCDVPLIDWDEMQVLIKAGEIIPMCATGLMRESEP